MNNIILYPFSNQCLSVLIVVLALFLLHQFYFKYQIVKYTLYM